MDLHQIVGIGVIGLLVFRLCWFIWGGIYARFSCYYTTPRRVLNYFQGDENPTTHTPPGIALAVVLIIALTVQALTGLATTDLIFNEGPLTKHVSEEVSQLATATHHRAFWVVLACISVHLLAHIVYTAQGNALPLAMFRGTKNLAVADTQNYWSRALLTTSIAAFIVFVLLTA